MDRCEPAGRTISIGPDPGTRHPTSSGRSPSRRGRAVAANTGTPPAVLGALVPLAVTSWTDDEMLAVLVKNPHTPASALGAIARLIPARLHVPDAPLTFRLGIALFTRPDTPDDVLFALLDDPDTTTPFRKVAAREAIQPSVRERLSTDRSERVRRAAARSNPT